MTRSRGDVESPFEEAEGAGERAAEKLIDQFRSICRVRPFGPNLKSEDTTGSGRGGGVEGEGFPTTTWAGGVPRCVETTRTTAPVVAGWSWRRAGRGLVTGVGETETGGARVGLTLATGEDVARTTGIATLDTRFVTTGFPTGDTLVATRATVEVVETGDTPGVASAVHGTKPGPITRQARSKRTRTFLP